MFCSSYTTKADGKGSGLGLSVCKTIIEEFSGTIDLKSNIGEGTVVSIKLPGCSAEQDGHY
jgi:two-component system NtrC family sensor kinase